DFMSLSVVFILATLLGFASHAPGSIGVFDAAMLVALPQFGREQLLATLLVFRVLYFVIPFTIAISIMGTREMWLSVVVPWKARRRNGNCSPAEITGPAPLGSAPTPLPTAKPVAATANVQPIKRFKSQG